VLAVTRVPNSNESKIPSDELSLGGFPVERLMHFLNALVRNIEIMIRKNRDRVEVRGSS
jgi:hypothetical protein